MATIVENDGAIANEYDHEHSVNAGAPSTPWAMYLSADRVRFDFLAFDFDSSHGNASRDAGRFSLYLDELRINHLVAESGPTGGRHVWIALEKPTEAAVVREIAQLAKFLLPSLDIAPLLNPVSGCVRPPGATHRYGGTSRPLGPLSSLLSHELNEEGIEALRSMLLDLGAELPAPVVPVGHGVDVGAGGHPFIPGDRLDLSEKVAALLRAPIAPGEDASYRLATVLAGMANARWRYEEVATHAAVAPAFEHVRTVRQRTGRAPRAATKAATVLSRAWRHAVEYVATHPATPTPAADESGYVPRLTRTVHAVEAVQERADAMPGLWGADRASQAARARRGTYSRRAVLDALCLFMVQAASTTVEADCRRLSAHTSYGKTTTAQALHELAAPVIDGDAESAWIVRVGVPERGRGQRYRLSKRFSTENHPTNRTQALRTPPPSPLASRDRIMREIGERLELQCQDVFAAPHSLGRHAGNVYRHLPVLQTPVEIDETGEVVRDLTELSAVSGVDVNMLSYQTGLSLAQVKDELEKLSRVWLATPLATGWVRPPMKNMRTVAVHLGVDGYLEERRRRYQFERERWAQWLAELIWMHQWHKDRARRPNRPDPTAIPLFEDEFPHARRPRYPRRRDGRADHTVALRLIARRHAA